MLNGVFLGVSRWWFLCSDYFFGVVMMTRGVCILLFVGVYLFFVLGLLVLTLDLGPPSLPFTLPDFGLFIRWSCGLILSLFDFGGLILDSFLPRPFSHMIL
jgi:hypothetical protein